MKRFTETEKWRDSWFQNLSPEAKLVFTYIADTCDAAGVWDPNERMAEFSIGKKLNWAKVYGELRPKIARLASGKIMLIRFIDFQYGKLTESCKPHVKVLSVLQSHGITYPIDTLSLGYHGTPKEEDRIGRGKEEETESGALNLDLPNKPDVPDSLNTPEFLEAWELWKRHRSEIRHPLKPTQEKAAISELEIMGADRAVRAIRYTIFKGWRGLREPEGQDAKQFQQPQQQRKKGPSEPIGWKAWLNHERPDSVYSAGGDREAHEWGQLDTETQWLIVNEMKKGGS
jgi:hypothetical protein